MRIENRLRGTRRRLIEISESVTWHICMPFRFWSNFKFKIHFWSTFKLFEISLLVHFERISVDQNSTSRLPSIVRTGSKSTLQIVGKWTKIEISHVIINFGDIWLHQITACIWITWPILNGTKKWTPAYNWKTEQTGTRVNKHEHTSGTKKQLVFRSLWKKNWWWVEKLRFWLMGRRIKHF